MRKSALLDSLDDFTHGYLEAAVWSSNRDDGEPLDRDFSAENLTVAALRRARSECRDFQLANASLLATYHEAGFTESDAGNDFWLTRNRHGAGFWDRGLGQIGRDLADAAHACGGQDLYVWRGRLHFT